MAKIESNIPVPSDVRSVSCRNAYGFGVMRIGDSMFFDGENTKSKQMTAARIYGIYHGWKFTGRTIDGGLRIWRVE